MADFKEIGTATIPGNGTRLRLLQRNEEFSIRIAGTTGELMNSRLHGSEDALATLACERIAGKAGAHVLIGGLGMGFTLAAASSSLGEDATATVAELVPEVLTRKENNWIYSPAGIAAAQKSLTPDGVLAYWSAGQDHAFTERLRRAGFSVDAVTVRAHRPGKGARHVIWLAW